jgi:hypothetical protein
MGQGSSLKPGLLRRLRQRVPQSHSSERSSCASTFNQVFRDRRFNDCLSDQLDRRESQSTSFAGIGAAAEAEFLERSRLRLDIQTVDTNAWGAEKAYFLSHGWIFDFHFLNRCVDACKTQGDANLLNGRFVVRTSAEVQNLDLHINPFSRPTPAPQGPDIRRCRTS